jgi:hypothetical protein
MILSVLLALHDLRSKEFTDKKIDIRINYPYPRSPQPRGATVPGPPTCTPAEPPPRPADMHSRGATAPGPPTCTPAEPPPSARQHALPRSHRPGQPTCTPAEPPPLARQHALPWSHRPRHCQAPLPRLPGLVTNKHSAKRCVKDAPQVRLPLSLTNARAMLHPSPPGRQGMLIKE